MSVGVEAIMAIALGLFGGVAGLLLLGRGARHDMMQREQAAAQRASEAYERAAALESREVEVDAKRIEADAVEVEEAAASADRLAKLAELANNRHRG